MKKYLSLLFIVCLMPGISSCQINLGKSLQNGLNDVKNVGKNGALSNDDVVAGLKEALNKGISTGAGKVSQVDGYFGNPSIKILMPPDAQKVEKTLREAGLGDQVDKAILSMNRAAELAAKSAQPIFVDAIKKMTISDAMNILKGPNDAATSYLKKTTTNDLTIAFTPVIKSALDQTQATKYWKDVFDSYNKIPFVEHVNPDLVSFVTQKGLEGLFKMIADEEAKIRQDPLERTSDILKKVFGSK